MDMTVLQEIMKELRKDTFEIVSQKSIADWIQANYLEVEEEQIKDAYKAAITIDLSKESQNMEAEEYYNEIYKKDKEENKYFTFLPINSGNRLIEATYLISKVFQHCNLTDEEQLKVLEFCKPLPKLLPNS